MREISFPSSFVPSDDELFSSLNSPSVSESFLRNLLKRKGIFIALNTPKKEMAKYISSLILSYHDHEEISTEFSKRRSRKDAVCGEMLSLDKIDISGLESILHENKKIFDDESGVNITKSRIVSSDGKIRLNLEYSKMNYAKNAYSRKEIRNKSISITQISDGQYYLESPRDDDIDKIKEIIVDAIKIKEPDLRRVAVTLSGVVSTTDRISFFDRLMREISGFEYESLIKVSVSKPADEDSDEDEAKELQVATIKKASFTGKHLSSSQQLLSFLDQGFHTYTIVWDVLSLSDLQKEPIRLEAKFSDPENCDGFAFFVRGVTLRNPDGSLKSTVQRLPNAREEEISIKIYQTAVKVMNEILDRYSSAEIQLPEETDDCVDSGQKMEHETDG